MTIEEILAELSNAWDVFPREAVEEAIRQREEITPELLRILERDSERIAEICEDVDYSCHVYAMFLLSQFREPRAYPLLVKFFSQDQKLVDTAMGDITTEDLGRMLASVCNGDISLIQGMVENPNIDEYARSAAQRALVVLVAEGVKSRDEVMEYFRSLFHGKLERKFSNAWNSLVSYSSDLYAGDLLDEIEKAYDEGLVESFYIGMDDIEDDLALGKDALLARLAADTQQRFIRDVVKEMSDWACFKEPKYARNYPSPTEPLLMTPEPVLPANVMKGRERNLPCPCGSGKKYKKCCGK